MVNFQRIYWSDEFDWVNYARLYDAYCKTKNNFYIKNSEALLSSVIPKEPILEVGCGTGALSMALLKNKPSAKITAIDISKQMLFYYRQNFQKQIKSGQIKAVQGNAENINQLVRKKFKTVFVPSAIWDFEIGTFARNISKVMEKGSSLLFNLPAIVLGEHDGLIAFIEDIFKGNQKYRRIQKDFLIEEFSKNNLILTSLLPHEFWLTKQNIINFFGVLKLRYPFICFPESMPYKEKFKRCESTLKKSTGKLSTKGLKDKTYVFVFEKAKP